MKHKNGSLTVRLCCSLVSESVQEEYGNKVTMFKIADDKIIRRWNKTEWYK